MKLILLKTVKGLGQTGDVVQVKPGFGRNYLIPQKLALPANAGSAKAIDHQKRIIDTRIDQERKAAEEMAEKLQTLSCTIERLVGDEEKLFGSVTTRDIAAALAGEGFEIDHSQLILEEPIKKMGVFTIAVKLNQNVESSVKVWVVAQ